MNAAPEQVAAFQFQERIINLEHVAACAYELASNLAEFDCLTDQVYLDALHDISMWPDTVTMLREVER